MKTTLTQHQNRTKNASTESIIIVLTHSSVPSFGVGLNHLQLKLIIIVHIVSLRGQLFENFKKIYIMVLFAYCEYIAFNYSFVPVHDRILCTL